MASKFVEEEVAQQDEPQISIYTKYEGGRKDSGRVNEEDAKESDKYDDTIVWNDKTFTEAIKPFLGRGAKSFATKNEEASSNNSNNNNNKKLGADASIDRFCGGDIALNYANDAFNNADVIFVSRDKRPGGKLGSVRGFLCLNLNKNAYDEEDVNCVYIDLICNAKSSRGAAGRQGKILASGKLLLNAVKDWTIAHGFTKIALKALETVIPYYYKFGWRFIKNCDSEEKPWIEEDVQALFAALKAHKAKDPDMENLKLNEEINTELQKFKKWLPKLNDETLLRTIIHKDHDDWEDLPKYDQNTIAMHVACRREAGYPMLLCLDNSGKQNNLGGGRRRRKRRTRKKKTRKSRKKRRKKHHKKRTRRKRKGGNRKNINKNRATRRARRKGVNIMNTIQEYAPPEEPWQVRVERKTANNIMKNHSKKVGSRFLEKRRRN